MPEELYVRNIRGSPIYVLGIPAFLGFLVSFYLMTAKQF
jgi:hypothetical protein